MHNVDLSLDMLCYLVQGRIAGANLFDNQEQQENLFAVIVFIMPKHPLIP